MLLKVPKWTINSVNPLHLMIKRIDRFVEQISGDKYLNISNTQRNNEVLRKYLEVWNGIKDCVEKINDKDSKDFMKTKFNSDDDIPLNRELYFPTITVVIRCVFAKDGKYYPRIFLDDCLHEV